MGPMEIAMCVIAVIVFVLFTARPIGSFVVRCAEAIRTWLANRPLRRSRPKTFDDYDAQCADEEARVNDWYRNK